MTAFPVDRHLIGSYRKQVRLGELIGNSRWQLDTVAGILSFDTGVSWSAQILGTESYRNNTWLWAWANIGSNLSPALVQASQQMRQFGLQHRIPEIVEPVISLTDEINGHVSSMIASGVLDANAYYRGPYDEGAVFLLIKDPTFPHSTKSPLAVIAHDFPRAISAFPIPNHRLALTSYLDQCGITHIDKGNAVVVNDGDEPILAAVFDDRNRLTKLEVRLASDATI